jgi:hypothetical protein
MTEKSTIASTGDYGVSWPQHFVLTQGLHGKVSSAGWTYGNEGFVQQTFLGASIRSFNLTAGFGDTTSSLSVELIEDEYNKSDSKPLGEGDDVYHSGVNDKFSPPVVGSPVFFKFGKNFATTEQAWRKTFDDIYGYDTIGTLNFPLVRTSGDITNIPSGYYLVDSVSGVNTFVNKSSLLQYDNIARGSGHFVFGGILQSYNQDAGNGGNPLYSVNVQDPREILSNSIVILRNYAGTTFNNKNLFNVYGYLEYDPSDDLQQLLDQYTKNPLRKIVNQATGEVSYVGDDTYQNGMPITGQGFSRSSEKGIPWYRVNQGLNALFEYNAPLPLEYKEKGFGGVIDFRGYKYVVDFSGIPLEKIPKMYFIDFDNIDLLSLAQELCDVISHDLFVSLLPVIDHPASSWLYNENQRKITAGDYTNIVTGIIRIDAINRSKPPRYGAIQDYLLNLKNNGTLVENKNLGYEVSNVTTDKFIVGAQEVEMYYFHNNKDRDNLELRKFKNGLPNKYELLQADQWSLETSLKQQILPFYGFLGKDAVTIPRGFGPYQQILLDSSSLDAYGVGNYYVATEMELRAAAVSYESWVDFLLIYNERYMSEVGEDQIFRNSLAQKIQKGSTVTGLNDNKLEGREYAVDVPRCVFNSDKPYMGDDGYPASPCSPPYGYPLYYKRAEKIGIPQAGVTSIVNAKTRMFTNYARAIKGSETTQVVSGNLQEQVQRLRNSLKDKTNTQKDAIEKEITVLQAALDTANTNLNGFNNLKNQIKSTLETNEGLFRVVDRLAKESMKNSRKVYEFIKEVADKHLGRTFLVKIPTKCNISYNKNISVNNATNEIQSGPFGFKPQPISTKLGYSTSNNFYSNDLLDKFLNLINYSINSPYEHYLDGLEQTTKYSYGALKSNYNPITEKWEFNYSPEPQGGFFNFALFNKTLSLSESNALNSTQLPLATQQDLTPMDLKNFVEENGRIKCYVRYNNSQYLSFKNIGKDHFSQQLVTNAGYIPDIMTELNNTTQDNFQDFNPLLDKPKTVAFVKCEVDSKFYMCPKITSSYVTVFAQQVEIAQYEPITGMSKRTDSNGCINEFAFQPIPQVYFIPKNPTGGSGISAINTDFVRFFDPVTEANIVDTEYSNLDNTHVYAIITVPGRIEPTIDARYMDGPYQAFNCPQIKSAMTCDVVRGPNGFQIPGPKGKSESFLIPTGINNQQFTAESISNAIAAYKNFAKAFTLALPEIGVGFNSPSPVYPDVVALPLVSHERCYGPWLSSAVQNSVLGDQSQVRYSNIGGKIEFIKNENLAPWNYAGYQLMNEAGALEAQFSNSLLLFVERGGFTMVDAPMGIALGRELQNLGPLVTSINVSVGDKVTTTVNMDLYTSKFGKLQKQKEIAISQAVRERQRIIDNQNDMIRRGLLKSGSSKNLGIINSSFAGINNTAKSYDSQLSSYEQKKTVFDKLIFSVATETQQGYQLTDNSETSAQQSAVQASTMSTKQYQEVLGSFATEQDFSNAYVNSAVVNWSDIGTVYSEDVYHKNMPHVRYVSTKSNKNAGNY